MTYENPTTIDCLNQPSRADYLQFLTDIISDSRVKDKDMEKIIVETIILERERYNSIKSAKDDLQNTLDETYMKYFGDAKTKCSSELEKIMTSFHALKENLKQNNSDFEEHAPAFIFVLNYDNSNKEHVHHISENDNVKTKNIYVDINSDYSKKLFHKVAYEDGAILIDGNGVIMSTNVLLTNLDPEKVIARDAEEMHEKEIYTGIQPDWKLLGFRDGNVNARHKNSLVASYHMEGSVIYTLSEQTGHMRRFENGHITHSTMRKELNTENIEYRTNRFLELSMTNSEIKDSVRYVGLESRI